jgi:hypothetical protein
MANEHGVVFSKGEQIMQTEREATSMSADTSLKAESLLLEELRHLSENASQINFEISGTYNAYLIVVGFVAIAVATLQIFHTELYRQGYTVTPIFLDVVTIGALIFGGILSFIFLLRFVHLVERESHNLDARHTIRAFYIHSLKAQMPTLIEAFSQQDDPKYFSNVPSYLCYTVSLVGSLSWSVACYLILSYIAQDAFFIFKNLFCSVCIFIVTLFLQQWYYRLRLANLKGDAMPQLV